MRAADPSGAEHSPFGQLLREFRIAAKLSQEELAERAQVSVACIGVLERGVRRAPRRETFALLASGLALSPRDRARFQAAAVQASATRQPAGNGDGAAARGSLLQREERTANTQGQSAFMSLLADRPPAFNTLCADADFATLPYVDLIAQALGLALRRSTVEPNIAPFWEPGDRRLLTVLQGFEHFLGAAAAAAQQLVKHLSDHAICPDES